MSMQDPQERENQLYLAIEEKNCNAVRDIINANPQSFTDRVSDDGEAWIALAARVSSVDVVKCLLDAGFNVNALSLPEEFSALDAAIGAQNEAVVKLLLERGADPNVGRPMISALTSKHSSDSSIKLIQLLLSHGADINRKYQLYGDPDDLFTALDYSTNESIRNYLRKQGAEPG
jgi:ankyrin repeat protein